MLSGTPEFSRHPVELSTLLQVTHPLTCLDKVVVALSGQRGPAGTRATQEVLTWEAKQSFADGEDDGSGNGYHLLSTYYVRDAVIHAFHTLSLLPPTGGASIIIYLLFYCFSG